VQDDLFFATVGELSHKLRKREISALELARAFAARVERLGPRYNALALPLTESATDRAREIDRELKRERFRGPLQGIPYGAKDLLSLAGKPTTWGAKPYAGQVFDYTATVLTKLDRAAAVLTAKLAMVELAGGGGYRYAAASLTGPGLNPWDRTRWSGGSSSGSGIAVAAGLAPFAIATETYGSIVTPASFCGVTGLRPTYGLVSRHGAMALSWTLDKIGPICRTAEDCGYVLHAMSGGDSKDPGSAGKSFYYTPQFARAIKDLRIGFAPVDWSEWPEPDARPVFEKALADVKALGARMVEVKLPDFPYGPVIGTIISAEGASAFETLIESGEVDQLADQRQIAGLRAGLEIPARDYLKAMRIRRRIHEELRRLFADVDVLVTPGRLGPAPKVSEPLDREPSRTPPRDPGLTPLLAASNLAGFPALCLPCGFIGDLPLALQFVGLPFSENTLIAVGKEYQSRTDWHRRRPPVPEIARG
jgi:aspartyl-tRNA(Asn)/glutamyl-tRNA(Gln) amidotransferase subunit A